uniref:Ion_trans domain-containing protein n=1 Tax=Steinernema glaseri TaxID=37863 RepID=A0A1I7YZF7_9BILA
MLVGDLWEVHINDSLLSLSIQLTKMVNSALLVVFIIALILCFMIEVDGYPLLHQLEIIRRRVKRVDWPYYVASYEELD